MKIAIVGAGFVGLTQGAVFADIGHKVICVDCLEEKIEKLENFCKGKGEFIIYEPRLPELVKRNYEKGNLKFTTNLEDAVKKSKVIFITVGTPPKKDGSADLTFVINVAKEIGEAMNYKENVYKVIAIKSTVPVGTHKIVKKVIAKKTKNKFDVVSNPEFLAEGTAVENCFKPSRIVIGTESKKAAKIMIELYQQFVEQGHPIFIMDNTSAEIVKYASNAYLASQIVLTNIFANLARESGGDWSKIKKAVRADERIGKFVHDGLGFGGSCFRKDMEQLICTLKEYNLNSQVLEEMLKSNKEQKLVMNKKMKDYFGSLENRVFAVWGLSFKPETSDMRDAASIDVVKDLLKNGAKVKVYDPAALEEARLVFSNDKEIRKYKERVEYCNDKYVCVEGCDALIITVEWNEFKNPDYKMLIKNMKTPVVFDGKDILKISDVKKNRIVYFSVGRSLKRK